MNDPVSDGAMSSLLVVERLAITEQFHCQLVVGHLEPGRQLIAHVTSGRRRTRRGNRPARRSTRFDYDVISGRVKAGRRGRRRRRRGALRCCTIVVVDVVVFVTGTGNACPSRSTRSGNGQQLHVTSGVSRRDDDVIVW